MKAVFRVSADNFGPVIDTYEAALAFLEADPTIEDEQIQVLYTVKVGLVIKYAVFSTNPRLSDDRQ